MTPKENNVINIEGRKRDEYFDKYLLEKQRANEANLRILLIRLRLRDYMGRHYLENDVELNEIMKL